MAKKHRDPLARLKKGAGKGEGADYVSPIHQRDFSSIGRTSRMRSSRYQRVVQTLSDGEARLFTYLEFHSDFVDVREQFIHDPIEETLTICLDLGINHPRQRGKLFPVSTDFVATRHDDSLIALEVKPKPIEQLSKREQEINQVREIWWRAHSVPYHVVNARQLNRTVSGNLSRILQNSWRYDERVGINPKAFTERFLRYHDSHAPLHETLSVLASKAYPGLTNADLLLGLFMAIYRHVLFVDLRHLIGPAFRLHPVSSIAQSADWPW